jgi:hypothetical protein
LFDLVHIAFQNVFGRLENEGFGLFIQAFLGLRDREYRDVFGTNDDDVEESGITSLELKFLEIEY